MFGAVLSIVVVVVVVDELVCLPALLVSLLISSLVSPSCLVPTYHQLYQHRWAVRDSSHKDARPDAQHAEVTRAVCVGVLGSKTSGGIVYFVVDCVEETQLVQRQAL